MPIKVREGGAWVQVSDGADGANEGVTVLNNGTSVGTSVTKLNFNTNLTATVSSDTATINSTTPLYVSHARIIDKQEPRTSGGQAYNDNCKQKNSSGTFTRDSFIYPRELNTIQFDPDDIIARASGLLLIGDPANNINPDGSNYYGGGYKQCGFNIKSPGSYRIDWSCPFYNVGRFQTCLIWRCINDQSLSNYTSPSNAANRVDKVLAYGTSEFAYTGRQVQSRSFGSARVTCTTPCTYTINYQTRFSNDRYDLGVEGACYDSPHAAYVGTNTWTENAFAIDTSSIFYSSSFPGIPTNVYSVVDIYKEG